MVKPGTWRHCKVFSTNAFNLSSKFLSNTSIRMDPNISTPNNNLHVACFILILIITKFYFTYIFYTLALCWQSCEKYNHKDNRVEALVFTQLRVYSLHIQKISFTKLIIYRMDSYLSGISMIPCIINLVWRNTYVSIGGFFVLVWYISNSTFTFSSLCCCPW